MYNEQSSSLSVGVIKRKGAFLFFAPIMNTIRKINISSKTKIVRGILVAGIILIGSWGIWRIWNSMTGRILFYTYAPPFLWRSMNQQPYFPGERESFIGKFEVLKDLKWHVNITIPKVGEENIYNFHIANTTLAKVPSEKGDVEFKDFANKDFFFIGNYKYYPFDYLIMKNPNDKWLRQLKAAHKEEAFVVFEIEQMIPIK